MKDLKSPYTLKYYGCYKKSDHIWIIMEYCDSGSVQDLIDAMEDSNICLTEDQIGAIVSQVLKALDYLHSMKKIHRDVKAGNVLLNSKGMAKLADFGISAQQIGDEQRFTTIGSSYWMAPETFNGSGYDCKADIWSLGITLLEMAEGIPPLIEEMPHKVYHRIVNEPPPTLTDPSLWTDEFKDFVSSCLQKEPEKRSAARELLEHPFIKKTRHEAIFEIVGKNKKRGGKKQKEEKAEEEGLLRVYFQDNSYKSLLVPAHATTEDVCRISSELFKITKSPAEYKLYLVEEDQGKINVRVLGAYDLPCKVFTKALAKRRKKRGKSNPFSKDTIKYIYK